MELRRRTVEHIRHSVTHRNTPAADGYENAILAAYRDLDHYCETMGRDGVYVEDIEVHGAVTALNVNISIIDLDEDHDVFVRHPNPNSRTREVYLIRYDTSNPHYREYRQREGFAKNGETWISKQHFLIKVNVFTEV